MKMEHQKYGLVNSSKKKKLENTGKETKNLIKALCEYIQWHGNRDCKTDDILPIEKQKGTVVIAMNILKELT